MSRTLRAMPYKRAGQVRGRKAALVKNTRKGSVPPSRYDKRSIKAYNRPWAIAWGLLDQGMDAHDIAVVLNKSYGLSFPRAIHIGKFVVRRKYGIEQENLGRTVSI
jgi:hypothetical protein